MPVNRRVTCGPVGWPAQVLNSGNIDMDEIKVERMQALCWDAFSVRFGDATRDELERFPKLKAEWEQWQAAWRLGIEAFISVAHN